MENGLRAWEEAASAAEDRTAWRQRAYSPILHQENGSMMMMMIDNDEKEASSKNTPNTRLEHKNHNLCKTKIANIDALFMTKMAEKPYP